MKYLTRMNLVPMTKSTKKQPVNIEFDIDGFNVRRICDKGLWLITTGDALELGMLFWRYQEFYESPNPEFVNRTFLLIDYVKWFCKNKNNNFTYFNDYAAFNIPGVSLDYALSLDWQDMNKHDYTMLKIVNEIKKHSPENYYIVGAKRQQAADRDHEIAHGLFYLFPVYQEQMKRLVDGLGTDKWELFDYLKAEGYSDHVLVDEAQAYMATGLFEELAHLDKLRIPFMKTFATFRTRHIKGA